MYFQMPAIRAAQEPPPSLARARCYFSPQSLLAIAAPALAEHTRWWRQTTFEEFDKGTAKGVALRSDGKMFLAPRFAEFADANLAYLLQIRADSKGNLYAAGGSNAKVLRIDASGKSTSVFESSELAAQALALDAAGNLFVGTSPDGKVYKVTPAGPILRLLRSQDEIHLGPGRGQGRNRVRRDRRYRQDFFRRAGRQGAGFLFQRGNSYSIAGARCERKRAGRDGAERAGSAHSQGRQRTAAPLSSTKLRKRKSRTLLQAPNGDLYVAAVGEKTPPAPGQPRPITTDTNPSLEFCDFAWPGGKPSREPLRRRSPIPLRRSSP